jgi:alkylhydroperoxidase family enzyme
LQTKLLEHFKKEEIIELTAIIAYQNLSSKFNSALDIKPNGFCEIDKSK